MVVAVVVVVGGEGISQTGGEKNPILTPLEILPFSPRRHHCPSSLGSRGRENISGAGNYGMALTDVASNV